MNNDDPTTTEEREDRAASARCNACGTFQPKTTAFDVRRDASSAVLVCDGCLRSWVEAL